MNPKAKNEDFHITSNYNCTNRQLVELLFQKLKVQPYIVDIKTKEICECLPEYKDMLIADRALDARFDNTKIKTVVKDLNFKTSLDEGLDMVIDYWMKSSFYEYDYQFEGRIDKLLSKYVKVNFVRYPHANKTALIVYYLYRYLPLKWASKLAKYVKKR